MKKKILITGATGNIGVEVISNLIYSNTSHEVFVAVRDIAKAKNKFKKYPQLQYKQFDFENQKSFADAFNNIDIVFLLRPPHIADVNKVFVPMLNAMKQQKSDAVVFLSVQGAETNKLIPHYKIEQQIRNMNFEYIFLRPSYFMQNLTTTLLDEIKHNNRIFLPAGNAHFNWIDANDIGKFAGIVLNSFERYSNTAKTSN